MVAQDKTNKTIAQNIPRKPFHGQAALVEFARAVRGSVPAGQGFPAPISIRPPSHLLKLSTFSSFNHTDWQLVVFSISTDVARQLYNPSQRSDLNVSRKFATLSVPTDVAIQLLSHSANNDSTQQASVHPVPLQQRAVAVSGGLNSNTRNAIEKEIVRQLLELSRWRSSSIKSLPLTSVFSEAELAVAVKLLNLFACQDYTQSFAAAVFTEDDLNMAHSLLNRFAFEKSRGRAAFHFTPDDITAAHQLRAFCVADDLKRSIGPIFFALRDSEESLQLVPLPGSNYSARHLLELCISQEDQLDCGIT